MLQMFRSVSSFSSFSSNPTDRRKTKNASKRFVAFAGVEIEKEREVVVAAYAFLSRRILTKRQLWPNSLHSNSTSSFGHICQFDIKLFTGNILPEVVCARLKDRELYTFQLRTTTLFC